MLSDFKQNLNVPTNIITEVLVTYIQAHSGTTDYPISTMQVACEAGL
jgi:hypothetical protein